MEKLKRGKLRESIHPGDGSVDAIIEYEPYDTFQQIRTIMAQPMSELEALMKKQENLALLYRIMILSWELGEL